MDGDDEIEDRPEGPSMMSFQSCNITEVRKNEYR